VNFASLIARSAICMSYEGLICDIKNGRFHCPSVGLQLLCICTLYKYRNPCYVSNIYRAWSRRESCTE
jgi:hypothetical protein